MPATSRAFVKASLLYLCLGVILGVLLLTNRWLPLGSAVGLLRVSHIQLLIVGWLTQLIMGVGWWLFPPLPINQPSDAAVRARRGQTLRGNDGLFWATFALLNAGVLLRAIGEPIYGWTRSGLSGFLTGVSGLLVALATVAFVVNIGRRVRELRRRE
jgi:hypothetical protein